MDLSKVLDDVYSGGTSTSESNVPEWADEAHLDQVFAGWTPGPPADAPAAEREMAAHVDLPSRRRIDDDLATALTDALTREPVAAAPAFPTALAPREPARVWSRGDDDVLPAPSGRKSGSRFARR